MAREVTYENLKAIMKETTFQLKYLFMVECVQTFPADVISNMLTNRDANRVVVLNHVDGAIIYITMMNVSIIKIDCYQWQ